MEFLKRIEIIDSFQKRAYNIAITLCYNQKTIGDFYLKTKIGFISADLLVLSQILDKKILLQNFGLLKTRTNTNNNILNYNPLSLLLYLLDEINDCIILCTSLVESTNDVMDYDLIFNLKIYIHKFFEYRKDILAWIGNKPTDDSSLNQKYDLKRDCLVFDFFIPSAAEVDYIRNIDLKDSLTRSLYLSSNAYLEITSIDIISDLIYEINLQESYKFKEMAFDLSRQLSDECKHAEILASRVENLGFELGIAPIHVQTWVIYKKLNLIADKIVAQQVLQEGIGLDSSACNIMRMLEIGDADTANVYTQITADEKNHVALGIKWFHNLDERPIENVIEDMTKIVNTHYVLPKIPIVPELRKLCGFSDKWIEKEIKDRGKISIKEINDTIFNFFKTI
jgi:uncharacterized ferritin-like protein (DUF455 family)